MSLAPAEAKALGYHEYVERMRAQQPDLAAEVGSFHGLEKVLDWMRQRGLERSLVDLVGQDEFSYDFLIELQPSGRWLVFGVT